jgi:hypothetical protein
MNLGSSRWKRVLKFSNPAPEKLEMLDSWASVNA